MNKKNSLLLMNWKLNKFQQRNLLIITVIVAFLVMGLFNLFWEPLLFLLYASWVILNKGEQLTRNELLGLVFVKGFMFYSCIARVFGRGPALFLVVPIVFIAFIVYYWFWRRSK